MGGKISAERQDWKNEEKTFFGAKIRNTFFSRQDFPAVAFMFPPYSKPDFGGEDGRRGHGGFEYEIASAAAGSLGLNLVLRPPSTGVMWGSRVEGTDNFTGNQ